MDSTKCTVSERSPSTASSTQLKKYQDANQVLEEHLASNTRNIIYRNEVFSAGQFLDTMGHPGGEASISEYYGKDVTEIMHEKKHSKNAYKLLQNYKVGEIISKVTYSIDVINKIDGTISRAHGLISEEMSAHLAKRFDLTKPIYPQLIDRSLTKAEYLAFITEPKIMPDPSKQIRIFKQDFFEFFSSTEWYHVPMVWLPFTCMILWLHWNSLIGYSVGRAVFLFVFGLIEWSLGEYVLHRFLFHIDEFLPRNGWVFGLHFIIHGIHHAFPQDPGRLVFPLFNAFVVGLIKLMLLCVLFGYNDAVFVLAGFGLGYIAYDMFHYYTHHSNGMFMESQVRYHQKHHHKDPTRGFGVTTPFWDWVFGTMLKE